MKTSSREKSSRLDAISSHGLIYLGFLTPAFTIKTEGGILRLLHLILVLWFSYLLFRGQLRFQKSIIYFLLFALALSLISVRDIAWMSFALTQAGAFLIGCAVLFSYFRLHRFDLERLLRHYINIAVVASCIGIIQSVSYLVDFRSGYDLAWLLPGFPAGGEEITTAGPMIRIFSVFGEPGYLAVALAPAGFLSIRKLVGGAAPLNTVESVIILSALSLTFSTLAYIGLLASVLANTRNRYWFLAALLFVAMAFGFSKIEGVNERIQGLMEAFSGDATGYENISSLLRYYQYLLAVELFSQSPITGVGLGSFEIAARSSLTSMPPEVALETLLSYLPSESLQLEDAGSMFLRLPVELGLVGVCCVVVGLLRNRVPTSHPFAMYQTMCLVFFLVYCLRTGQYIRFELFYFLSLYYAARIASKHKPARENAISSDAAKYFGSVGNARA